MYKKGTYLPRLISLNSAQLKNTQLKDNQLKDTQLKDTQLKDTQLKDKTTIKDSIYGKLLKQ